MSELTPGGNAPISISINKSRIKTIEITDGENVLGTARFNPYDVSVYKKYIEFLTGIEKDEARRAELTRELQTIERECEEMEAEIPDGAAADLAELERLNEYYQKKQQRRDLGRQFGDSLDSAFEEIKKAFDSIFGEGVSDLLLQGYQDDGLLTPLIEAAGPFFEAAAKERGEKVQAAKLNREQRRAAIKGSRA